MDCCIWMHFGYLWDCWEDQNWKLNRSQPKVPNKNPLIDTETLSISKGPSIQLLFSVGTNKHTSILCQISGPSQQLIEENWRYFPKIKPKEWSETYPCWMFHPSNTTHANRDTTNSLKSQQEFVGKATGIFGIYKTLPKSTHALVIFPYLYTL